jgi:transcriptional regulator with XRE-family HTH domain
MAKEKIEKVIKNITSIRTKKGYTYDNMAHELSITPAAYRKIETGETKLTVERLFKISEILNTSLPDLLEINNVFQQTNNENAIGYQQKIEKSKTFIRKTKKFTKNCFKVKKNKLCC